MDHRVFKRTEVDPERRPGWVVDLSPAEVVNPDCYWYFRTRKAALEFVALVDGGMDSQEAAYQVNEIRPDDLLTPAEAAERTGTGESTWRARAAAGKIPGAIKKGKQWLIPESALGES